MLFSSKEGWCFLPLFCQEQWVCFDYSTLVLLGADLQLLSLSYTQTAHLDPDPEPSNISNSCLHESGRVKNPADLFYWCWAAYLSLKDAEIWLWLMVGLGPLGRGSDREQTCGAFAAWLRFSAAHIKCVNESDPTSLYRSQTSCHHNWHWCSFVLLI